MMRLQPTALLKTLTGKTVVALLLVTSGVGAAAAAGADVPLLEQSGPIDEADEIEDVEEVEVEVEVDGSGDDGSGGDSTADEDGDTSEVGSSALMSAAGDDGAAEEQVDGEERGDHPDNHGDVVSTFARDNPLELEGCEKGQATAAVARGDVDPEAESVEDDLAPYLAKCEHDDDSDAEEEVADADEDVTQDEVTEDEVDPDWKTLRDEGRDAVHLAQQSFVESCGDAGDAGDISDGEDGEDGEDADAEAPMTDECAALLDAAKDARDAWKLEWKTARDAAKERALSPTAPAEESEDGSATGKPDQTGKPDKTGKPDRTGKPDKTGKPEKTGKP